MYQHGISVLENPTPITPPINSTAGLQVVVGTAPINMSDDMSKAVNVPFLANSWGEAIKRLGYSSDFENYSLCQSMMASFQLIGVGPVVFINVLDPAVHKESVAALPFPVKDKEAKVNVFGVLLDSLVVKNTGGTTTYVKNTDYVVAFDKDGYPIISLLDTGAAAAEVNLTVNFDKLDPSAVTEEDIIGGYDVTYNTYSGLECIQQVYPKLGLVPGIVIAPGWSKKPTVAAVMRAKSKGINGAFNCINIADVDTASVTTYQDVPEWKNLNGYNDPSTILAYPKVKSGEYVFDYSAVLAASTAYLDAQNDDVPYKSPSNKSLPITGTVNEDGSEVFLDQSQANYLNGAGVVTALNLNGWRTWGNNTAAYPSTTDPKDRFIAIKRVFFWWGNTFILTYQQKVDDPTNTRLIESIVDSENIRANGFQAQGKIAGAKMEFRKELNPITDILNGKIRFIQKIAAFPPAEHIVNELEFDPNMLSASIFGGE
ncbi:MAG: phage tail sheath family protein [Paenisporosarcina sp.]